MRKSLNNSSCRIYFTGILSFILCLQVDAQIKIASWIGYNSKTDHFPLSGTLHSPAVVHEASVNFNNLEPGNDQRSSWTKEKSDRNGYLTYKLNLNTHYISFDKFVIHGLAMGQNATAELRWSIDGFASPLGRFKTKEGIRYSLTSVDLSQQNAVSKKEIEFRVYYYNVTGPIEHDDKEKNPTSDGTPQLYQCQDCIVSIWAKDVSVLPAIEQFRGKADQGSIQLKWQTSTEQDISHFEIERSSDGLNFINIGNVTALKMPTSINKYHFTDRTVGAGNKSMALYRLWMLDNNGNATYTNTVAVLVNKNKNEAVLFPNPQLNSSTIAINSPKEEIIRYSIFDSGSNRVLTARYSLQQGNNTINLRTGDLKKGIYTLELAGTYINQSVQFIH